MWWSWVKITSTSWTLGNKLPHHHPGKIGKSTWTYNFKMMKYNWQNEVQIQSDCHEVKTSSQDSIFWLLVLGFSKFVLRQPQWQIQELKWFQDFIVVTPLWYRLGYQKKTSKLKLKNMSTCVSKMAFTFFKELTQKLELYSVDGIPKCRCILAHQIRTYLSQS